MDGEYPEVLKCPVCFEIPPEEIFQCKNGHTICKICSDSLSECPQCKVNYDSEKIRCRALEAIRDSVKVDCTFKSSGCTVRIARGELKSHLRICKHRGEFCKICECLGYKCDFVASKDEREGAFEHLQETHSFLRRRENTKSFRIRFDEFSLPHPNRDKLWTPLILEVEGIPGAIILLSRYNANDKACSFTSVYIPKEVAQPGFENVSVMYTVKARNSLESPNLQWTTSAFTIEQALKAIKVPYIHIPMQVLLDDFVKEGELYVHFNVMDKNDFEDSSELVEIALRANLEESPDSSSGKPSECEEPVFTGYLCNACRLNPMVGYRYKCLQCQDYDLCKNCMDGKHHDHHVFARIMNIKQHEEVIKISRSSGVVKPIFFSAQFDFGIPLPSCNGCAISPSKSCTYVCLQCKPIIGYCQECFGVYGGFHDDTHIFAVADSNVKLSLVIQNMIPRTTLIVA